MNLVILEQEEVSASGDAVISGVRAAHVIKVLGAVPGGVVRVGILDGPRGSAAVESIAAGRVALRCKFEANIPPRPRVDLLLAVPRPKVLRRLWAQIAAIGVGRIALTNAERVERNYFDAHALEPAHYGPLLVEGLQQARDTRLPRVSVHRRFRVLIEDEIDTLFGSGDRLVGDPDAPRWTGARPESHSEDRVLLAVGPEGGWNAFELELLGAHGFRRVGLGPRTLRTDTACVALLTLAHAGLTVSDPAAPGTPRP